MCTWIKNSKREREGEGRPISLTNTSLKSAQSELLRWQHEKTDQEPNTLRIVYRTTDYRTQNHLEDRWIDLMSLRVNVVSFVG